MRRLGFFLLCLGACTKAGPGVGATTIKGELNLAEPQKGKAIVVYVDEDSDPSNGSVAKYSATLGRLSRERYQIDKVPSGKYFVYAVVDVGDNGAVDVGDFQGFFDAADGAPPAKNATVPASGEVSFDIFLEKKGDESWPDIAGTLLLPGAAADKPYVVVVDDNEELDDGFVDIDSGVIGADTNVRYSLNNIEPGAGYLLYAWVDVNEDGDITPGDFMGVYTGTLNLSAARQSDAEKDITLTEVTNQITIKLKPAEVQSGKVWKIAIDKDNVPQNGSLRLAEGVFEDDQGEVSIQESNIPPGDYYIYATIDMDDDGAVGVGDLFEYEGIVATTVSETTTRNIGLYPERPLFGVVTGKVTLPATAPGRQLLIDTVAGDSPVLGSSFVSAKLGTSTEVPYFLTGVPDASYFLRATLNQADAAAAGDFYGYFGGSGSQPPAMPNLTIANKGAATASFSTATITNIISGKMTFTKPPTRVRYHVYLDTDGDASNGVTRSYVGRTNIAYFVYQFTDVPDGDYIVHGWVDVNDNDEEDAGDFKGASPAVTFGDDVAEKRDVPLDTL